MRHLTIHIKSKTLKTVPFLNAYRELCSHDFEGLCPFPVNCGDDGCFLESSLRVPGCPLWLPPLAALWLWNWIRAVTSTYLDGRDLRSTPEGVLCEPRMDGPGAEKVFCAGENNLEQYWLINSHFLGRCCISGRLACAAPSGWTAEPPNHLPEVPCGNLLIIFMMPGQQ